MKRLDQRPPERAGEMRAVGRALGVDLRRALLSPVFLLSVGVMLLWMYLNCAEILNDGMMRSFYTLADYLFFAVADVNGNLTPLLLAIAVIPFSWSYCQDKNCGYLEQAAERVGFPAYARARALAVGIAAFLAMELALALFTGYLACLGILPAVEGRTSGAGAFTDIAAMGNFPLYYLYRAVLSGLGSVLAAEFGLLVTVWLPNAYMAFILPLLACYVGDILVDIFFELFDLRLRFISPSFLLFGQPAFQSLHASFFWCAGLLLALSLLCGVRFRAGVERRRGK